MQRGARLERSPPRVRSLPNIGHFNNATPFRRWAKGARDLFQEIPGLQTAFPKVIFGFVLPRRHEKFIIYY